MRQNYKVGQYVHGFTFAFDAYGAYGIIKELNENYAIITPQNRPDDVDFTYAELTPVCDPQVGERVIVPGSDSMPLYRGEVCKRDGWYAYIHPDKCTKATYRIHIGRLELESKYKNII